MDYMARHGLRRARPAELVHGTVRVITVSMNYLPRTLPSSSSLSPSLSDWRATEKARWKNPSEGIISLYARGRDYHKVVRQRLQRLAESIAAHIAPMGFRVFTDSAPVMEVELATRSGQGWRGKHTLLLKRQAGSMFFLGEIFVDIPLPLTPTLTFTPNDVPVTNHCGACTACIRACPTQAIVAPYRLDARRCISYLTIEYGGSIPVELRPLMGNRIYGCDDCQLVCPWNKFAQVSTLPDFDARDGLTGSALVDLFAWTEAEFLRRTEGSPIRRIGWEKWLRNIAVALGNAPHHPAAVAALQRHAQHPSPLVREHVAWALERLSHGTV